MTSYKSMSDKPSVRSPWFWVPSLYFAQGIPYVAVMIVSVLMYKRLGVSNTDIALYTSWLNLPSGAGGARALYHEPTRFPEYSVNFTFLRRSCLISQTRAKKVRRLSKISSEI